MKFKRKRPRMSGSSHGKSRGHWMSHWPAWWDRMFHTRPQRRENHKLERDMTMDRVDPDEATGPLGNHKPHNYYW